MIVKFDNFQKRRNSTKIPLAMGTQKDCKLKDNCSVHNPVLICATNASNYNYAYIADWERYYFITDTVYLANNLVEYHLTEDVLASNKAAIAATKAFIAYSSTGYNNFIVDSRINASTVKQVQSDQSSAIFGSGHYIITTYNKYAGSYQAAGVCSAYYCDDTDLAAFATFLNDKSSDITTYFNGNLMSGIASVKWIPYDIPTSPTQPRLATSKFAIGNVHDTTTWDVDEITYYGRLTDRVQLQWNMFYSTDFRRSSPFVKATLYLPGIGNVDVNLTDFGGSSYLYVRYVIEYITGDVAYYIENSAGDVLQSYSTNVAVDIPFGNMQANISGAVNSGIGILGGTGAALAGVASGNIMMALGGAAAAVASATSTALAANQTTTSIMGGSGGRGITVKPRIVLTVIALDTEDPTTADYIAIQGRPVGKVDLIGNYSGYVQTLNAHVALFGSDQEMEEVNNFLNSGIYFE